MMVRLVEKPAIDAVELAALRLAVGWEGDTGRIRKVTGRRFFWAGAYAPERLVGYVEVISDGVDDAYIRNLIVHPDYQRQGIGLKLLALVLSKIKEQGIKTANVLFEPGLEAFYRKAGFKIIGGGLIEYF